MKYLSAFWKENRKFMLLLATIVFFKSAIADLNSISGRSMQPTLLDGDKVWVNKLAYDIRIPFTDIFLASRADPRRGDIIIIDSKAAGKRLVKRIVGLPGEVVAVRSGIVYVNDVPLEEPFPHDVTPYDMDPITLGPLSYFVLGDNRGNSNDSRAFGPVRREDILGRVWLRYWPLSQMTTF